VPREEKLGPRKDDRGPREKDRGLREEKRGSREENRGSKEEEQGSSEEETGSVEEDNWPVEENNWTVSPLYEREPRSGANRDFVDSSRYHQNDRSLDLEVKTKEYHIAQLDLRKRHRSSSLKDSSRETSAVLEQKLVTFQGKSQENKSLDDLDYHSNDLVTQQGQEKISNTSLKPNTSDPWIQVKEDLNVSDSPSQESRLRSESSSSYYLSRPINRTRPRSRSNVVSKESNV